jgi:hypothetical protein
VPDFDLDDGRVSIKEEEETMSSEEEVKADENTRYRTIVEKVEE